MRRLITFFLSFSILLSACAPSLHDRLGKGFYSDTYTEKQVQAAANVGRVKNLGRFSKDSFACFNYSPEMTDENVMAPAIQKKLCASCSSSGAYLRYHQHMPALTSS